jgi:hypothetical protein
MDQRALCSLDSWTLFSNLEAWKRQGAALMKNKNGCKKQSWATPRFEGTWTAEWAPFKHELAFFPALVASTYIGSSSKAVHSDYFPIFFFVTMAYPNFFPFAWWWCFRGGSETWFFYVSIVCNAHKFHWALRIGSEDFEVDGRVKV